MSTHILLQGNNKRRNSIKLTNDNASVSLREFDGLLDLVVSASVFQIYSELG